MNELFLNEMSQQQRVICMRRYPLPVRASTPAILRSTAYHTLTHVQESAPSGPAWTNDVSTSFLEPASASAAPATAPAMAVQAACRLKCTHYHVIGDVILITFHDGK